MAAIRRAIVTGQVQGVGYRAFVAGAARQLDLEGWVRNRRDGSVEAVFAGPEASLDQALTRCRRGPAGARVESVDWTAAEAEMLALRRPGERFSQLPTV